MAFSSVPDDPEESRGFLQRRLALFGKSIFLLFLALGAIGITVMTLTAAGLWQLMRAPPYHLIPIFGAGAAWLICRRGKRSVRVLLVLDAAIPVMVGIGLAVMLLTAPPIMMPGVPAALCLTHLLVVRAILVPSDWRRTLWISALTVLAAAPFIASRSLRSPSIGLLWAIMLPTWCAAAVVVASWTSHVIFRLRRRVVEARRLGQYTLEDKIGEGGMGIVYRARHALLRRPTVVKLLPLERAGQANLARFEREVQLTSQLSSPNTVAVFDFGRTGDGTFYYAMEHLDGLDLEQLVARDGAQPAARVIHLLAQVCTALAEAHESGLVHRDIKPSNVMLCRHGGALDVIKVLDFGLVKDVDGGDVKLTQADAMVGTPLYASPEAIREPDTVDARSDLYAVGALGYYLLTGRTVFAGRTIPEVCAQHLYEEPTPPSRWMTSAPRDLEAVLLACLAKPRDERPAGARALRAALLACEDAGRWTDAEIRAWWARARPPAGALAVAATLPGTAAAADPA